MTTEVATAIATLAGFMVVCTQGGDSMWTVIGAVAAALYLATCYAVAWIACTYQQRKMWWWLVLSVVLTPPLTLMFLIATAKPSSERDASRSGY